MRRFRNSLCCWHWAGHHHTYRDGEWEQRRALLSRATFSRHTHMVPSECSSLRSLLPFNFNLYLDMHTLLYLKWITNKGLYPRELRSLTCNILKEKRIWKRVHTCIHTWVTLLYIWKWHRVVNRLYSNIKEKSETKQNLTDSNVSHS